MGYDLRGELSQFTLRESTSYYVEKVFLTETKVHISWKIVYMIITIFLSKLNVTIVLGRISLLLPP